MSKKSVEEQSSTVTKSAMNRMPPEDAARQQMLAEIGEDELKPDQTAILHQKYGLTVPVIDPVVMNNIKGTEAKLQRRERSQDRYRRNPYPGQRNHERAA